MIFVVFFSRLIWLFWGYGSGSRKPKNADPDQHVDCPGKDVRLDGDDEGDHPQEGQGRVV